VAYLKLMRRLVLGGLLVALALVPSAVGSNQRPALQLVDRAPFVVRGLHFKTGEQVTVILLAKREHTVRVAADGAGSFNANFGNVEIERCEGFRLRAIGSLGSRVVLKPFAPACLPDQAPVFAPGRLPG
jgi:hypothetical protein